jgi:hypothetical protein
VLVGAAESAVNLPENTPILRWLDACPILLDEATKAKILATVQGDRTAMHA